jgi:hypothetical protein
VCSEDTKYEREAFCAHFASTGATLRPAVCVGFGSRGLTEWAALERFALLG